jgi:hypothetical protein
MGCDNNGDGQPVDLDNPGQVEPEKGGYSQVTLNNDLRGFHPGAEI